jgi:hypothetical protein
MTRVVLPMSEKNYDAGYIRDSNMQALTSEGITGDVEILSGGTDGEDMIELEQDIKKMEKMMRKHEKPTSFMWIVPTVFTEFYHEFILKETEE